MGTVVGEQSAQGRYAVAILSAPKSTSEVHQQCEVSSASKVKECRRSTVQDSAERSCDLLSLTGHRTLVQCGC